MIEVFILYQALDYIDINYISCFYKWYNAFLSYFFLILQKKS